ncbi:MAG: hypothetical protein ACPLPX_09970, partial [Candidatus Kapaibacteriota bacterium]
KMKKIYFVLLFVLLSGLLLWNKANAECPPGYREITVYFTVYFDWTDSLGCNFFYTGPCFYKAHFCVSCGLTAPTFDIILTKIELDPRVGKGYYCTCATPLDKINRPRFPTWRLKAIESVALSELLYQLTLERYCGLNFCDGDPPNNTIYVSYKKLDCYKLIYVPICTGDPPIFHSAYIRIEYCTETTAYCQYEYRVCVKVDPITGLAYLEKEVERISHNGTPECLSADVVLPDGIFPRYGDCFPEETECMYNQYECQ